MKQLLSNLRLKNHLKVKEPETMYGVTQLILLLIVFR